MRTDAGVVGGDGLVDRFAEVVEQGTGGPSCHVFRPRGLRPSRPVELCQPELITRLLANRCEICRNTDGITVHHVRSGLPRVWYGALLAVITGPA